ncbi:MAG: hypothetical protein GXO47_05460 [Chlorobi bacterium]|nr:hypothetical protein [Chlorobiota bacterium]
MSSYRHIKSFKDFEAEKVQLYYNLRLTEKKLQLSIYNIKKHFSIEKMLYQIMLTKVVDPLFAKTKARIASIFGKQRKKIK